MEAGRRSVMAETGEEGRGRGVAANADRISFVGCDGNVLSSNSGDEYTNSHWIKCNKRLNHKGYELYFTGKYLATRKLVAVHGRLSLKLHLWLKISV